MPEMYIFDVKQLKSAWYVANETFDESGLMILTEYLQAKAGGVSQLCERSNQPNMRENTGCYTACATASIGSPSRIKPGCSVWKYWPNMTFPPRHL
jgi:hypothetical protein